MKSGNLDEFSREELVARVRILEQENAYLSRLATDMAIRLGEMQIKEQKNGRKRPRNDD